MSYLQQVYAMTTQQQIRKAFWREHPNLVRRRTVMYGNRLDYPTDTRVRFCDYVDTLARNNHISEALASRVTL